LHYTAHQRAEIHEKDDTEGKSQSHHTRGYVWYIVYVSIISQR
jgi:hypothetical protein